MGPLASSSWGHYLAGDTMKGRAVGNHDVPHSFSFVAEKPQALPWAHPPTFPNCLLFFLFLINLLFISQTKGNSRIGSSSRESFWMTSFLQEAFQGNGMGCTVLSQQTSFPLLPHLKPSFVQWSLFEHWIIIGIFFLNNNRTLNRSRMLINAFVHRVHTLLEIKQSYSCHLLQSMNQNVVPQPQTFQHFCTSIYYNLETGISSIEFSSPADNPVYFMTNLP